MDIDKEMKELFELLDNNCDIKNIDILKSKITKNELTLIENYRNNPTIENKKKLYENKIIDKYFVCENNINYLIMQINYKFKRSRICQK